MSFLNWESFIFKLSFTSRGHGRGIVLHKPSSHHKVGSTHSSSAHKPHHRSSSHRPHSGSSFTGHRGR